MTIPADVTIMPAETAISYHGGNIECVEPNEIKVLILKGESGSHITRLVRIESLVAGYLRDIGEGEPRD